MKPVESGENDDLRANLLTQEIKFAKMLAGNVFDGAIKEKHIDKLATWLKDRAACTEAFTDKDCMRLWKGLFYSMWMSDKPLPQENLANKISALLHAFDRIEVSLQFFAAFLNTMALEWNGIDQWRIDKFMMLVRKVTREMIRRILQNSCNEDDIDQLNTTLKKTVLGTGHVPRGLFMHFTELYFEEVAKLSNGEISTESVTKLLAPFMFYVASQSDYKLIQFVVRHVFNHLLFQSESGRNYKEKFDAWKSMNFPGKSINEMELDEAIENDEEENGTDNDESDNLTNGNGQVLDPRAGRVDVVMSEIKFDPMEIVSKIEDLKYQKFTRVRNRKCLNRIVSTYTKFAGGVFPIGIQRIKIDRDEIQPLDVEEKATEFIDFENDLYGKQRELKKLNKRKRKQIVTDSKLFDEFQAKSNKVAKIKHEANTWTEEDISEETPTEETPVESPKKLNKLKPESKVDEDHTPKRGKKQKTSESPEWKKPLEDGEVEYFIPSKKHQMNGVAMVTTTKESVTEHQITPSKGNKLKTNAVDVLVTPNKEKGVSLASPKSPKTPKIKTKVAENTTPATPAGMIKKLHQTTKSPKSTDDKKVNSTSKLAQSKTSTPNIFTDKGTPLSEKRVKIALKMNRSQEVTEYMRQLKQSPHLPYDGAKQPSKGVLKPNLAPSPINPFYKKLIGIE